jgi:hypothetical protein
LNPYLFQVALAILLMYAAVIGTTKFILEVYSLPVLSDAEWALERAKRSDVGDVEMGNLVR